MGHNSIHELEILNNTDADASDIEIPQAHPKVFASYDNTKLSNKRKRLLSCFLMLILLIVGSSYCYLHKKELRLEEALTTTYNRIINPTLFMSKKYLYISRHPGTTTDFRYMASTLNLTHVSYLDSEPLVKFKSNKKEYSKFLINGWVDDLCSEYDVIFLSDSLADGWSFFMDESDNGCDATIVFIITNRFDVGIEFDDRDEWYRDFNTTLKRDDMKRTRIVANNPFELAHLKYRNIVVPDDSIIIRPFGYTEIQPKMIPEDEKDLDCIIVSRVEHEKYLVPKLIQSKTSHNCTIFSNRYGGPLTLNQYNSIVIHFPYQVSTMKMWENAAYGVITAIPSPDFYTKICDQYWCKNSRDAFSPKDEVKDEDWWHYVDFYMPEFSECFVQFDSWDELDTLLTEKSYLDNAEACMEKMEKAREDNLEAWREFLMSIN